MPKTVISVDFSRVSISILSKTTPNFFHQILNPHISNKGYSTTTCAVLVMNIDEPKTPRGSISTAILDLGTHLSPHLAGEISLSRSLTTAIHL